MSLLRQVLLAAGTTHNPPSKRWRKPPDQCAVRAPGHSQETRITKGNVRLSHAASTGNTEKISPAGAGLILFLGSKLGRRITFSALRRRSSCRSDRCFPQYPG